MRRRRECEKSPAKPPTMSTTSTSPSCSSSTSSPTKLLNLRLNLRPVGEKSPTKLLTNKSSRTGPDKTVGNRRKLQMPVYDDREHEKTMSYLNDLISQLNISADVLMYTIIMCNGKVSDALHWLIEGRTRAGGQIWTPEDDGILRSGNDAKRVKLERKYGAEVVQQRMTFLAQNTD